jgi:hypothetical protein
MDVATVIGLLTILGAVAGLYSKITQRQAADEVRHSDNIKRFDRVENALGINDPDDAFFVRKSDMARDQSRFQETLDDHEDRIVVVERKVHTLKG